MKKRSPITIIVFLVILAVIFWIALSLFSSKGNAIAYSDVVGLFESEQVKSFVLEDGTLYLNLHSEYKGKTSVKTGLADADSFREEMLPLLEAQHAAGVLESYDFAESKAPTYYSLILPLLIVGLVLLIVWAIIVGRANANNPMANFGKARTLLGLPNENKVTFDDVAGADEERKNCGKWWISSGIPRSTPRSVPAFPMACCWLALPVPARPCLPGLWQVRQMCSSCPSPALTLWKCM